MRLEFFDFRQARPPIQVMCQWCNKWIGAGILDRDGPAFKAYYCNTEHAVEESAPKIKHM